jgi:hypothetical protein
MRADVMRPAYIFEPKYRVELLSRKDWTTGTGTPPIVKGRIWFTDGSRKEGRTGAGVYGQSDGRRLSLPLGQYATVFQAEVYVILACTHDIAAHGVPGKYVSICSDSQAALKAIRAVRTTYPLVRQCQEALENISIDTSWDSTGSPGMQGCEEIRLPMGSQRTALPPISWVRSRPWGSLDRILGLELIAGWRTSTGVDGGILGAPNDRLES